MQVEVHTRTWNPGDSVGVGGHVAAEVSKTLAEGQLHAKIWTEGGDTFFKEGECCKGS